MIGKSYFLLYGYYLEKEPTGDSDLIGLTRCGVFEDTPVIRMQLADSAGIAQHRDAEK